MRSSTILSSKNFDLTIKRLCYQLIENHNDFKDSVIIGLQPRGIYLAKRIHHHLVKNLNIKELPLGNLDVTFFRDDFRKKGNPMLAQSTEIDFIIEDKKVILVDDVLFTGRTIRAGLDAMLAFGRPKKVELLVLIERRFSRDLPIKANYIGKSVDSINSQRVKVEWKETEGEDVVYLHTVKA
jgi:pyrimidine operon attenuation protein / uracil phosphoribosyltransferase